MAYEKAQRLDHTTPGPRNTQSIPRSSQEYFPSVSDGDVCIDTVLYVAWDQMQTGQLINPTLGT